MGLGDVRSRLFASLAHRLEGASEWKWASTDVSGDPDIVLACCGTIPTIELLATTALLREHVPDLRIRFVNVTNLFSLALPEALWPIPSPARVWGAAQEATPDRTSAQAKLTVTGPLLQRTT